MKSAVISELMQITHKKDSLGDRMEMRIIASKEDNRVCWHADGRVTVTHKGQIKLVHNFNWE